jgi:hypothetical protein
MHVFINFDKTRDKSPKKNCGPNTLSIVIVNSKYWAHALDTSITLHDSVFSKCPEIYIIWNGKMYLEDVTRSMRAESFNNPKTPTTSTPCVLLGHGSFGAHLPW